MNNGAIDTRNRSEEPTSVIVPNADHFEDIRSLERPTTVDEAGTKGGGGTSSKNWKNDEEPAGGDNFGFKYLPGLLVHLEEKLPFTTMLVSLIGYIIISAFGHMSSIESFLSYIVFLIIVYTFYKLQLPQTKIATAAVGKKINSFFAVGFLTLLAVLLVILGFNWNRVIGFFPILSKTSGTATTSFYGMTITTVSTSTNR